MELESLGYAAGNFQRHPKAIRAALRAVQAEAAYAEVKPIPHEAVPALTLNAIEYFLADEIAKAIGWLAENDAQAAAKKAKEAAGDA